MKLRKPRANPAYVPVSGVMVHEPVCVHPDDTLAEALQLMVDNKLSALPVVEGIGKCVGMLSATDLLRLERELDERFSDPGELGETSARWLIARMSSEGLSSRLVREQMTTPPYAVRPGTLLADAARVMLARGIHRLVVTDDADNLLGIVSMTDMLRAFATGAPAHRTKSVAR